MEWAENCQLQLNFNKNLDFQRKKILMFSRWYKYFQFVSWNKISFWNVIAVVSLAKWKTLQNHKMYYYKKQRPTFSVWRENIFFSI